MNLIKNGDAISSDDPTKYVYILGDNDGAILDGEFTIDDLKQIIEVYSDSKGCDK